MDKGEQEKEEQLHLSNLRHLGNADLSIDRLHRQITQTVDRQIQEFASALRKLEVPTDSRIINQLERSREDFLQHLHHTQDQISDLRQSEQHYYRHVKDN